MSPTIYTTSPTIYNTSPTACHPQYIIRHPQYITRRPQHVTHNIWTLTTHYSAKVSLCYTPGSTKGQRKSINASWGCSRTWEVSSTMTSPKKWLTGLWKLSSPCPRGDPQTITTDGDFIPTGDKQVMHTHISHSLSLSRTHTHTHTYTHRFPDDGL